MKNIPILIGGAWPYANGSLHIGHIAALLPGDVLARYFRLKGRIVYYISGSDCHGTPITLRAEKEGRTPQEVSDDYHEEFVEVFEQLGFSYDHYGKTSSEAHIAFVQAFHRALYQSPHVYERVAPQPYLPSSGQTITDRQVVGRCPQCEQPARGEQCDHCGAVLEADQLLDPRSATTGEGVAFRTSKQLYIGISQLEEDLTALLTAHPEWRSNAQAFTKRYIDEGLRDRALTRDLAWGIPVPHEGYDEKRIYIWAENVLGYLSASKQVADARSLSWDALWFGEAQHYYVHGKDNIPFHTIILPALLLAHGGGYHLPDTIISSEHMTLEGRKIATSEGWAIWVKDLLEHYHPDALRYFFIMNGPEKRDTDFSMREFKERNNGELLGAFGNFVNRSLVFIHKYFEHRVEAHAVDIAFDAPLARFFTEVGDALEKGEFRASLERVMSFVRSCNKYFDQEEPWKTRLSDPSRCRATLSTCVILIQNLAVLLEPFLPFSTGQIRAWLKMADVTWQPILEVTSLTLPETPVLFERLV